LKFTVKSNFLIKTQVLLLSGIGDLRPHWLFCLGSLIFLLPHTFRLFGFSIFRLWSTWWRLLQN